MSNAADHRQLRSFIDRILRLKAEQDAITLDIREVYREADRTGFNKTIMGQLVGHLRKVEKVGDAKISEAADLLQVYLENYRKAEGEPTGTVHAIARMRGEVSETTTAPHDPDTGEIIEPQASDTQPAQAEEDRASAKSSSAAPGESGEQTQCATATVQFNDGPVIDMADRPAVERAAKEFMEKVHDDLDLPAFLDRRARVA